MQHPNLQKSLVIPTVTAGVAEKCGKQEKGKNVVLWTILACIPIVNFIILWYIVGTPNKRLEDKLDKILEYLDKSESS